MPSFNLVDGKWIPCIHPNGKPEDFSLKEVLVNAHEIKEIFDPSPLVTVSLHRLLLAILHRNFGPANIKAWQHIWKAKTFDKEKLEGYFHKWRHRFNLFDETRPFYQTSRLENAEIHPILHLAMEIASGNNAMLFDHNSDDRPNVVSPAVAARYVIATQYYAVGGGVSRPFNLSDSPLIRGLTVMVLGDCLFETLALNLLEYNEELPFSWSGQDLPIWEQEKPAIPSRDGTPVKGYLDYLTWQSRSIHLYPESQPPMVKKCQIQQNLKLPKQQYLDPFKCFQVVEDRGYVPLPVSPDKAVWRYSHALFQKSDVSSKRPEIFNWLARIENKRRNGEIQAQPNYSFAATGLATGRGRAASVLLWRHERLPLPLRYLQDEQDENLIAKLKAVLDLAEDVANLLGAGFVHIEFADKRRVVPSPFRVLASEILPQDQNGKVDAEAIASFVAYLSPSSPYWARLGVHFHQLLRDLADDTESETKTLSWWAEEVRKSAWQAFRGATYGLGRSARMLKAVTKAEDNFGLRLNILTKKFLEPYRETQEKGGEATE
jgi:CRISPR system Cascade subunit CasA